MQPENLGQSVSLWMATSAAPNQRTLVEDTRADVCIVGAGIAGITTAYLLAKHGKSVVVLDDGVVGGGQTQRTTAHLSNALDDRYFEIERLHGSEGAKLAEANGVGANLRGGNYTEADLSRADLTEANLEGGIFQRAHLEGATLRRANLKRARMAGVLAPGADFSGTNLLGAEAQDADFSGTDFRFSTLVGAVLEGALFKGANVAHADFSEAKLGGSSFVGAKGEGAKFTGQLHLKLVLAAGAFLGSSKKKVEKVEDRKEQERKARVARLEREAAERDRSVATRPGRSDADPPEK